MLTGRLSGSTPSIGCPSMTICPSVGTSKPASIRSSVVLPQPDGPSSAKNSPSSMSRWASSTAVTEPPKRFEMCWMEMMGLPLSMTDLLLAGTRLEPHADRRDGQGDQDQHGRCGVHFGRHALPDHRVDFDWEGGGCRTRNEERDEEVVERQGEGQQAACNHTRHHVGQRNIEEGLP